MQYCFESAEKFDLEMNWPHSDCMVTSNEKKNGECNGFQPLFEKLSLTPFIWDLVYILIWWNPTVHIHFMLIISLYKIVNYALNSNE